MVDLVLQRSVVSGTLAGGGRVGPEECLGLLNDRRREAASVVGCCSGLTSCNSRTTDQMKGKKPQAAMHQKKEAEKQRRRSYEPAMSSLLLR